MTFIERRIKRGKRETERERGRERREGGEERETCLPLRRTVGRKGE